MNLSSVFDSVSHHIMSWAFLNFRMFGFLSQLLQVLPVVETGFSSAHVPAGLPAGASSSTDTATNPSSVAAPKSAAEAPLARSLDDSPIISSLQQSGSSASEGDTWML
jgi:hypothetical protein